jgi:uncharacterized membrane-anchored protein YitT (DUF2179 family)
VGQNPSFAELLQGESLHGQHPIQIFTKYFFVLFALLNLPLLLLQVFALPQQVIYLVLQLDDLL